MKKLFLILTVLLFAISMGAVAQNLTDSASLNLSGTVGEFVSIDVTPEPAATNLALSNAQNSQLPVATVTVSSNTAYEVDVNSGNSFNFTDGNDSLAYVLYYDGTQVSNNGEVVASGSSANAVSAPVAVTYNAASPQLATGTYSDTVTFTVSSTN